MGRCALRLLLVFLYLCTMVGAVHADDDGWGEEGDDSGFDEGADIQAQAKVKPISVGGFLRSRAGVWVDRLGDDTLSTARQSADLHLRYRDETFRLVLEVHGEYDLAYTLDEEQYDSPTMDVYEARILNGEQFIAASLGQFEVALGRQIVAWGEGDVFSPLDVVNPRDQREPGLADLDDLRLATLASRVSYFTPAGRFELMVTHEAYFGERPSPRAEYSPLVAVLESDPAVAALLTETDLRLGQVQPRYDPSNWSAFARFLRQGEGYDWGVYVAWLLDRQGVVAAPDGFDMLGAAFTAGLDPSVLMGLVPDQIQIELDHRRYWLVGHSGSVPLKDFLLKYELVAEFDKPLNTAQSTGTVPQLSIGEGDVLTGMLGLTWSGWTDSTLGVEGAQSVLLNTPGSLLFPVDITTLALRIGRTFLRETLRIDAAGTTLGWRAQYGWLARAEASYELTDGLKIALMYVHFGTGDTDEFGPFVAFDDHDQVLLKLRWDFIAF
ncbi:MAG: DUF1302 family protein [Myxococcota bacterium]|nr:DUF1302 family protein [Myxococcota bacterium]